MHRVSTRNYVGQPTEMVDVTTQVTGGGQARVRVNGVDLGAGGRFALPATPGGISGMQVGLVGPLGASCVVSVSVVDGGVDGDFLLCQPHNPAPINSYAFSVGAAPAIAALAATRGLKKTKGTKNAASKKAASKKRAKASKKGPKAAKKGRRQ